VTERTAQSPTVGQLARLALPAIVIGILGGLLMAGVNALEHVLTDALWDDLPSALGFAADGAFWIIAVLTATGLAVGAVVRFMPGRGGVDPATVELVSAPPALIALPGIAIAMMLGLAGGVSLGPENPVIAIGVGLSVWLAARFVPGLPAPSTTLIATAAIIGAMFGSPLAAALLLTEIVAGFKNKQPLWDTLFAPLVAAATGAIVTKLIGEGMPLPKLPEYSIGGWDLLSTCLIATAAAGLGIVAAIAMPRVHAALHSLRNPVLYLGIGGLVLGVLGVIGGPVTLFKGAHQSVDLVNEADSMSTAQLALITVVKIAALVVAAAASFRGGRIFPSMFIGVAFGLMVHSMFPAVPVTAAVGAAVLGVVLAVSRNGWMALFIAAAVTASVPLLTVLCLAILPAWLLVTRAPEMIAEPAPNPEPVAT